MDGQPAAAKRAGVLPCGVSGFFCVFGKRSAQRAERAQATGIVTRRAKPAKRASWSRAGRSLARRNRARRPAAGRAVARMLRRQMRHQGPELRRRNKHANRPIQGGRARRDWKDPGRENCSAGAARQASAASAGAAGAEPRAAPAAASAASGVSVVVAKAARKEPLVAAATTGSLGRYCREDGMAWTPCLRVMVVMMSF